MQKPPCYTAHEHIENGGKGENANDKPEQRRRIKSCRRRSQRQEKRRSQVQKGISDRISETCKADARRMQKMETDMALFCLPNSADMGTTKRMADNTIFCSVQLYDILPHPGKHENRRNTGYCKMTLNRQ